MDTEALDRAACVRIWAAYRDGLRPDPNVTVTEWAEAHRMLAPESSAEPGRYRCSRTPYLRAIMDALGPQEPAQDVVVMAASQLGKSESGNNWLGYIIDTAPGPTLMVQPTVEDAENYSKQRIAPMLAASARLRERVPEARSRDSGNTLLTKEFPGGFLRIVGSNAPSKLASTPIRYVFLDEVDRFPLDAGGEGDPVALARQRTATFPNRKILLTSTPTVEGFSRIEQAYLQTDRRRYWVPCPHCEQFQVLRFRAVDGKGGVVWPVGKPQEAGYCCEHCGTVIAEHFKGAMLAAGEWRADCESATGAIGFWISGLYSPPGWTSWADLAVEFTAAGKDPEKLKTFVNTKLAETWKAGDGSGVKAGGLASRAEVYAAEVPPGVLLLTAGVDVQDDRVEVEVVGWGAGEESWSIAWHAIHGDPAQPEIWRTLDTFLQREWPRLDGSLRIAAACVDTGGHHTQQVYGFCRGKELRRIWAIKGREGVGPIWPKKPSYRHKAQVTLYLLHVHMAKDQIYNRLRVDPPGPGTMHFPLSHPPAYFEQLTAERLQVTRWRGQEKREWVNPPGRRNEALDCRVYATAALHGLIASGLKLPAAVAIAVDAPPMPAQTVSVPSVARQAIPAAPIPAPRQAPRRRESIYGELRGRY